LQVYPTLKLSPQELRERLRKIRAEIEKIEEPAVEQEYFYDDRPIQLVFRTKPRPIAYFRAKPRTAYNPTIPQIKARLRFAELAKKAKGKKFKVNGEFVSDLPPAAEEVKKMRGERFGEMIRVKKWEIILAQVLRIQQLQKDQTQV
jgi:hypothetical protein